jgi:SAM-dependent methyltransferase
MVQPREPASGGNDAAPLTTFSGTDPRLRSSALYADVGRLHAQVALSWPHELEVLSRLGLTDGDCILDLGCGPGFVTEKLLGLFPTSTVLAIDLDPEMSALVSGRVGPQAAGRLSVLNSSALSIDLEDACVDFVFARFVFQHLVASDLAATEAFRLLRPGGRLAILDVDEAISGIVDPPIPALAIVGSKVARLQANRGGNRYVGRRLWTLLADAGFGNMRVDPILIHSDEVGIEPFLPQFDPERYGRFVETDGLTEADVQQYRDDFARFLASPHPYIAQLLLIVSGQKPVG